MVEIIFPFSIVLSGLMAGMHFANIMGYLPALEKVDPDHIIRFWKKADEYFGKRMPVFGCSLLVSQLATILSTVHGRNNLFLWLLIFGFMLIVADLVIAIKINTPVNKILRAWNGGSIPDNFDGLRSVALSAFYGRAAASIISFLAITIAYASWIAKS